MWASAAKGGAKLCKHQKHRDGVINTMISARCLRTSKCFDPVARPRRRGDEDRQRPTVGCLKTNNFDCPYACESLSRPATLSHSLALSLSRSLCLSESLVLAGARSLSSGAGRQQVEIRMTASYMRCWRPGSGGTHSTHKCARQRMIHVIVSHLLY